MITTSPKRTRRSATPERYRRAGDERNARSVRPTEPIPLNLLENKRQMEVQIHPLAFVGPNAKIGRDVQIGPFCVVEDGATIGDGCVLEARVSIKKGVVVGKNNHIFEGATIGGLPQCVGLTEEDCGGVIVGDGCVIRENVTIHRSMRADDSTVVGNDCMLMANTHVAHDCRIADEVIMANNVMLAGHVSVGRRAFVSGAAGAHQFVRIGAFAMVGGQAHLVRDVPPFVTVDGLSSQVVGLNSVGLRRAGFSTADLRKLKAIYRVVYKSGLNWREIVDKIEREHTEGVGLEMARFLATTTRGITAERAVLPTVAGAREAARDAAEKAEKNEANDDAEPVRLRVVDENGASLLPPPSKRRVV